MTSINQQGVLNRLGRTSLNPKENDRNVALGLDPAVIEETKAIESASNAIDDKKSNPNVVFIMPELLTSNKLDYDVITVNDARSMLTEVLNQAEGDVVIIACSENRALYVLMQMVKDLNLEVVIITDIPEADYSVTWMSNFPNCKRLSYQSMMRAKEQAQSTQQSEAAFNKLHGGDPVDSKTDQHKATVETAESGKYQKKTSVSSTADKSGRSSKPFTKFNNADAMFKTSSDKLDIDNAAGET